MIYLTGDIHGNLHRFSYDVFPEQEFMTKNDYIIVLGDFGIPWEESKKEKKLLNILNRKNFTILFIDGNHENHFLLNQYPIEQWKGGKVHKISDSIIHLMRGQIYNIDGLNIFTFGGASSIDKEDRIENVSWWKEELPNENEIEQAKRVLKNRKDKIDYVLTHTCSTKVFKELKNKMDLVKSEYDTCNFLFDEFEDELKGEYKKWLFGHFHQNMNLDNNKIMLYNQFIRIV